MIIKTLTSIIVYQVDMKFTDPINYQKRPANELGMDKNTVLMAKVSPAVI